MNIKQRKKAWLSVFRLFVTVVFLSGCSSEIICTKNPEVEDLELLAMNKVPSFTFYCQKENLKKYEKHNVETIESYYDGKIVSKSITNTDDKKCTVTSYNYANDKLNICYEYVYQ